jgi:hypothetical protein
MRTSIRAVADVGANDLAWLSARYLLSGLALTLLLSSVVPASAQMGGAPIGNSGNAQTGGGHGGRQRHQQQPAQPAVAPTPTIVKEPWPRLDTGAVLCNSRDDLVRYQTPGTNDPNDVAPHQAAECQLIQQRTAIRILDRDGASRTHVVSTDAAQLTGWTNAYLPSTRPTSVATTGAGH